MEKEEIKQIYQQDFFGEKKNEEILVNSDEFYDNDKAFAYITYYLQSHTKDAKILDAACGNGMYGNKLYEIGYRNIHLLDLFENVNTYGVYTQGSIDKLPYQNGSFDFIYCLSAIYYLDDPRDGIREFARCLKKGGHLILSGHTKYSFQACKRRMLVRFHRKKAKGLQGVKFDHDPVEYRKMCESCGLRVISMDGINRKLYYRIYSHLKRKRGIILPLGKVKVKEAGSLNIINARFSYHSIIVCEKI